MSITVVAILAGCTVAILLFLLKLDSRKRRRTAALLWRFSQAGSQHGLTFSSQELLGNTVIGLDGVKGKLLVLKKEGKTFTDHVLDLREVTARSLERKIDRSQPGAPFPEMTVLRFTREGSSPLEVTLYSRPANHYHEWKDLEQKGRNWEAILNKMTHRGGRPRGDR